MEQCTLLFSILFQVCICTSSLIRRPSCMDRRQHLVHVLIACIYYLELGYYMHACRIDIVWNFSLIEAAYEPVPCVKNMGGGTICIFSTVLIYAHMQKQRVLGPGYEDSLQIDFTVP